MNWQLFAQIIGYVGTCVLFMSYQMPKKRMIVALQVVSISIFTIHFSILGAWTGALMNAIALEKTVLYLFENEKWFKNKLFTIVFTIAVLVTGILTWDDWASVLPLIAMIINTLAYNLKKERHFRLGMFPCSPLWMAYAIHTGSIPALIGEILTTTSTIVAIIRYDVLGREKKKS